MKYSTKEYLKAKRASSAKEAAFIKNVFSFYGTVVGTLDTR